MKYQINKENYRRFDVMAVNKLPERSYFIPFSSREKADLAKPLTKRYCSDKVTCLNGEWDFKYYPVPSGLPDVLDTDTVIFDKLTVPSCWQLHGYGRPFYVNMRYQFPYAPPKIPEDEPVGSVFWWQGTGKGIKFHRKRPQGEYNSVGVYRRKFRVHSSEKRYILSFLGVASCVDVYVNGTFVGYSEGSHNTAEFDITPYLLGEDNELVAVVHRWCTGSYLECQDMFRHTGIFRDVLLYEMEKSDIWDISFSAEKTETGYTARVTAVLTGDCPVSFRLADGTERKVLSKDSVAETAFSGLDVLAWSAETPQLYDLYIETEGTCVKLRVGFKDVRIEGSVFYLNGEKVKLHGVNLHDMSPRGSYDLTPAQIDQDVRLMKEFNIDTVRTSHYPPDPLLLALCDEYGIYVVDEADLETHGVYAHQFPPTFNSLTNDRRWEARYLERVRRLYHRDKNHASVIIWSLGNESGGYKNTDVMYAWLREHSTLPVQYEGAIHSRRVAYDIASEMYPTIEHLADIGHGKAKKQLCNRPYFLCEYAYAQGVAPGAMKEYWREIYQYDNLMGGCVWEMCDHAILHSDGSYTYGGDHGEWEHDGYTCVNGIFYPDRSPSTGAKVVKFVYRPIRVRPMAESRYEVFNTRHFTPGEHFTLRFYLVNGDTFEVKAAVSPTGRAVIELPSPARMVAVLDQTMREVSREQLCFEVPVIRSPVLSGASLDGIEVKDGKVILRKGNHALTASEPYTILFRAPVDNDRDWRGVSPMDDYIDQREIVKEVLTENNRITVQTELICRKTTFLCTDTYESCGEGILVTSRLRCIKGKGKLPRFGKAFRLPESFCNVEYLGRNAESYCDMKEHAQIEKVSCRIQDMTEPNIHPQESGNRCDCAYASLSDGQTEFAFFAVDRPFELGIKPYSDKELLTMRHREDEHCTGTYVTISAFQMGVGTGACGPGTRPEYCFDAREEYTLRFVIK